MRAGDKSEACSKKCRYKLYDSTKRDKEKAKEYSKRWLEKRPEKKNEYKTSVFIRKKASCRVYFKHCVVCGVLFTANASGREALYCSVKCTARYYNEKKQNSIVRCCTVCGKEFVKVYGLQEHKEFCSDECNQSAIRAHRKKARAVREGKMQANTVETVISKRVYLRDGCRCMICGKKLAMDKKVPHPKAPTLDHIVPISLGGEHSYKNVRAAHFLCNSLRGNKTTGNDQLLLFGM